MEYNDFIDEITERVSEVMGEHSQVAVHDVRKNNGICLQGLSIHNNESKIAPTLYLNGFYEDYLQGKEISVIVEDIMLICERASIDADIDMTFFTDFEKVRKRIVYKLVNYDKNSKLLKEIPHVAYLDLAIVFYYIMAEETMGHASILIYNSHLTMWNQDIQAIYQAAMENTPRLLQYSLRNMDAVVIDLLSNKLKNSGEEEMKEDTGELIDAINESKSGKRMYVLSNDTSINGAACILYKDVLSKFAADIENDLYIIPSSVHEVILIPADECDDGNELSKMVREVNQTQVEPEEILSDHVYYYSRKDNRVVSGF